MNLAGKQTLCEVLITITDAFLVIARNIGIGLLGNIAKTKHIHRNAVPDRTFRGYQNIVNWHHRSWKLVDTSGQDRLSLSSCLQLGHGRIDLLYFTDDRAGAW